MSRRYLESESWENLLRLFASIADSSPFYYEKLRDKAKAEIDQKGGDSGNISLLYPKIADFVEESFTRTWYDSPLFEESRKKYASAVTSGSSPFKIELAEYCDNLLKKPRKLETEISLLKDLSSRSIAGIITTNYDCFLESLFPDLYPYIGQEQLVFSDYQSISEIYKIHGCCKEPESIVINSKDYSEFNKRNAYLAAKLLTVFVEHPIIFLGYSVQDDDVQKILQSIIDCLSKEKLSKLKNRLIFVEWDPSAKQMDSSIYSRDFGSSKSLDMTKFTLNDYSEFYRVLLQIKSKYPTRWMRTIKKDIYELTLTSDPNSRLALLDTEFAEEDKKYEYVVGFGILEMARNGYKGISTEKLYHDVVFEDKNYIPELVIEDSLPDMYAKCSIHVPIFKYLSRYSKSLPSKYSGFYKITYDTFSNHQIRKTRNSSPYHSIAEVIEAKKNNLNNLLLYIAALKKDEINVNHLLTFLQDLLTIYPKMLEEQSQCRSNVKKLILVYDWLRYGQKTIGPTEPNA